MVPWTTTSTDQRSFAVYDPRTWNRPPPALRLPELSLSSFKRQLKTHHMALAALASVLIAVESRTYRRQVLCNCCEFGADFK